MAIDKNKDKQEEVIAESQEGQEITKEQRQEQAEKMLMYGSPKDVYFTINQIKQYRIDEAVANSPIGKLHYSRRSKEAYKQILSSLHPNPKYILPGYPVLFEYLEPKYKEELEYYDRTPFVIMFGITKLSSGVIREVGVNLHYFPPQVRVRALNTIYEVFKDYYSKYFNQAPYKPNMYMSWNVVKALMRNSKVGFAVKMYIPVLRSKTYVLPTKFLATACYTEGHFSKATARLIYQYWRHYKK